MQLHHEGIEVVEVFGLKAKELIEVPRIFIDAVIQVAFNEQMFERADGFTACKIASRISDLVNAYLRSEGTKVEVKFIDTFSSIVQISHESIYSIKLEITYQ